MNETVVNETLLNELAVIAARYPQPRSALLPMLHLIQSSEGCVTGEGIEICAQILDLSAAEVSGVATFYTMYKRRPVGEYHVGVCTNTLCAVMGGDEIFDRLQEHLEVGNDETTEDGKITLEHIECNAACDFAPVMMVNWEFFDNQTPESAIKTVEGLRAGDKVCATRGAPVTTWRRAERVLAGYEDDLVDEGPGAAGPSLVGLGLAEQNGWAAPAVDEYKSKDAPAGEGGSGGAEATSDTKVAAAADSDSARAESETVEEESGASATQPADASAQPADAEGSDDD